MVQNSLFSALDFWPLKVKCETLLPISRPLSICTEMLLTLFLGLEMEAEIHLLLFRSSSEDSQKVSVELSLRLPTIATRLETFNSKLQVKSMMLSTKVESESSKLEAESEYSSDLLKDKL